MKSSAFGRSAMMVLVLCVAVVLASCSKKEVQQDEPLISPSGDMGAAPVPADSGVGTESTGAVDTAPAGDSGDLKTAYFEYDSFRISGDGRSALQANADWLKNNSAATIQIEGHCDERGTTEYNLALGERRANAARDFLVGQGIDRSRISVISYGEERPADSGHDEAAWARNRRAAFVILSR